jgi:hypothetical protein
VSLGTAKITTTAKSGGSATTSVSVIIGPPSQIAKLTGDKQSANVTTAVDIPASVVVKDEAGTPIPNVPVLFAVANGGGNVTNALATTSGSGVAIAGTWTLGAAGENTLTATVEGVDPVSFTATATQPVIGLDATSLTFTGTANGAAPASKNIAVTNTGTGSLSGLAIGTIIYSGGSTGWLSATLSGPSSPATLAVSTTQFGLSAGTYQATIPILGNSAGPRAVAVTLTVSAQVPASVAFPASQLMLQQNTTSPFAATLRDVNGIPMPGAALSYTSRNAGVASVSNSGITAGTITGVTPGTAVVVATSTGTIADSVFTIVTGADAAVVVSSITGFTLTSAAQHTVSIYVDMSNSTKKLASGQIDVTWSPNLMTYVSHAAGADVAAQVNSANASAGILRLSFADPAGLKGKVEILKITFKNSSTAGLVGELKLDAKELTATDFTDLSALGIKVSRSLIVK